MLYENQLRHALQIINNYEPPLPLNHFLRNYFKLNKRFGSRDRKLYRHLVYSYYRTGANFEEWGQQVKLVLSSFLVASSENDFLNFWLKEITPFSPVDVTLSLEKKLAKIKEANYSFMEEKIFPYKHLLGGISDFNSFVLLHLKQPYTWIKVYNEKETILAEAIEAGIQPLKQLNNAIAFAPAKDVTGLKSFKKGYFEIQDLSSQRTAELMQPKVGEKWWDCCAGAGGKTLLLKNIANVDVLATDKRASVLQNLEIRAQRHGYKIHVQEIDLLKDELPAPETFDGIIVDVPCTGSGTWGRNPERMNFFSEDELEKYTLMQKKISFNVANNLRRGGRLIYLTCSVFKQENENIVEWLIKSTQLEIAESKYFEGYNQQADTLFGTVFIKR